MAISSCLHVISPLVCFFLCSNICTFYYYVHDLLLYRPNSDTCKTCDSLQTCLTAEENAAEQRELEDELQLHKCKAERAYQQPKEDGALSRSSPMVDMFSFDVQQSLPTPKLSTSVVFYKTQMWTYIVQLWYT